MVPAPPKANSDHEIPADLARVVGSWDRLPEAIKTAILALVNATGGANGYRQKRALMLGMNVRTHAKLGKPPTWADCLQPTALTAQQFFATLHCTLPINGGVKENWPRAGLDAMASGVPVVAQNDWGWREMIVPGETGFLGSCDEELAHHAAMLAYDEALRLRVARNARERLEGELANPEKLRANWRAVFAQVQMRATP